MLKGIQLTLLVGPMVPVPAPRAVVDALVSATVTTDVDQRSGFQLNFTLSNRSPLQTLFLVAGAAMPPMIRIVLVAAIAGAPEVLIDGVMTDHQVTPGENGKSELVVTGEDLTRLMDYQDFSGLPYPAMPSAARVAMILAKYMMFGIVPLVVPTFLSDVESPSRYVPLHQGTDLDYIQGLARHVGYTFYIEPGPAPLVNKAYWGPEIKIGVPQPALNINMDAHTNCETLRFQINTEIREQPYITIHEPITKLPIPIPIPSNLSVLNPPLGMIPPRAKSYVKVADTSHLPLTKALLRGVAAVARSSEAVTADGTLDVSRYGRILKARRLVGVRGAGAAFDGLYFVRRVVHQLRRGQYKQEFKLSRNGLLSTVPRVPV
jgi:hypothetical protein